MTVDTGPARGSNHVHQHNSAPDAVTGPPIGFVAPPHPAPASAWAVPTERKPSRLARLGQSPSWLMPLAVLSCVGVTSTLIVANDPTDAKPDPYGPCIFRMLTGLDCPGCGGTRMVWFLLHGDLHQAARHHVVALLTIPVLVYAYVAWSVNRLTSRRLPTWKPSGRQLLVYALIWLGFSVLRNLPWEPFRHFLV